MLFIRKLERQMLAEIKEYAHVDDFPYEDANVIASLLAKYNSGQIMGVYFMVAAPTLEKYPDLYKNWDNIMMKYKKLGLFPKWEVWFMEDFDEDEDEKVQAEISSEESVKKYIEEINKEDEFEYEIDKNQHVIEVDEVSDKTEDYSNNELYIEEPDTIKEKQSSDNKEGYLEKRKKERSKFKKIIMILAIIFIVLPFALKMIYPYLMPKITLDEACGVWMLEGIENNGTYYSKDSFYERYDVYFDMALQLSDDGYAAVLLLVDGEPTEESKGLWYFKGHSIYCDFDDGSYTTMYKTGNGRLMYVMKVAGGSYKFHLNKLSDEELLEYMEEGE